MAINLYKDDDPNKKVGTAGASSVGASSVTPSPSPAPSPVPVAGDSHGSAGIGTSVEKGPETSTGADIKTAEDIYADLCTKIRNGQTLTPEEQKLYDEISSGYKAAEEKAEALVQKNKPEITKETKQKIEEYKILEKLGGTEYEKTSRILDKYLSENNEDYQALKEKLANTKDKKQKAQIEKQLQAKRDKIIHDWQAVVNPNVQNKNLSLKDRQRGIKDIGIIFAISGATGKPLEDFKNTETIKKINNHEFKKFSELIEKAGFADKELTNDEKISKFMDLVLANDTKYKNLQGKEKEEYRQAKLANAISDQLGIKVTPDMLNSGRSKILKDVMVGILGEAQQKGKLVQGMNINKIDKRLATKLLGYFEKQSDFINKLSKDEQEDFIKIQTKLEIMTKLDKDSPTELDILKYLRKNEKSLDKNEQKLYTEYKKFHELGISLDKEVSLTNAMNLAIIFGKDVEVIGDMAFEYVKDNYDSNKDFDPSVRNERFENCLEMFKGHGKESKIQSDMLVKFQKLTKATNEQIIEYKNQENVRNILIDASIRQAAKASSKDKKTIDRTGYAIKNLEGVKLSKKQSEKFETIFANMDMDTREAVDANDNFRTGMKGNKALFSALAAGDLRTKTDTQIQQLTKNCKAIGDRDYNAGYSNALIHSAPPERQVSLGKALLEVHDAGITEGVAAAEKDVDASVRKEYSENLTNEINDGVKKGYYTKEQAQNFQNARETGQTSYEREQAQKVSAESPDQNAGNSAANTSSKSKVSTTQQGSSVSSTSTSAREVKVTTGVLYISAESKTYTKDISATLSQLDSEVKKADAMKKVADNIAKIQAENLKYEEAAEKKKTAEQKQLAESIKAENEEKTEEQLKAELSSALEGEIANIESEISSSPEATEVQKQLGSMFEELRSYAKAGQMDQVFSMLSKIPNAQEKFLEKLATKHISTITHFIKGADKSILKFMCEKNPGIISTLDTNTLMTLSNSGFPKTMLIKYGDKNQIAGMFKDLQGTNNGRKELEGFYEIMGLAKDELDISDASAVIKKNFNIEGGDDFMNKLHENMKNASNNYSSSATVGSTVVPSWKEPDKKVPRELWG